MIIVITRLDVLITGSRFFPLFLSSCVHVGSLHSLAAAILMCFHSSAKLLKLVIIEVEAKNIKLF